MRVLRFSIMVGAVLAFAAACGGSGTTATVRPASTPGAPASVPAAGGCTGGVGTPVGIANNAFNPNATSVSVGGVVTWANADATTHTVTFDGGPDCGRLAQGASVSRTFDTAGSFTYHCTIHPFMTGTVTVQ